MRVAGEQNERMLQDEGRDPHIVGWDGSALLSQLPENSGVMMRGLLVSKKHTNGGFQEEAPQDGFVARSLTAHSKSGPQFSKHDKRQPDFLGEFDGFDHRHITPA